jgi:uncharacterized membrane protein YcaP (DUF421 family)
MGLVGFALLTYLYISAVKRLLGNNSFEAQSVVMITIAFLVQYAFFGSYINVVYIWLWLGIALGLGSVVKKN